MDLGHTLLEQFEPGSADADYGTRVLGAFCKQGATLTDEELARYTLERDVRLGGDGFGQRFREKWYDTTFNFCLAHDGALCATVGFEVEEQSIVIWQIQGIRGMAAPLAPLKWTRALVAHCVDWAREVGARQLFIVSVDHNDWAARHGHLDRGRGKLLYDVTARRSGFTLGDDGYYQMTLAD